jgi:hypothetical protein
MTMPKSDTAASLSKIGNFIEHYLLARRTGTLVPNLFITLLLKSKVGNIP